MALRDVVSALAPRPQVMPVVPPPVMAGGMGFPRPAFGMGFAQVAGGPEDELLGFGGINSPETGSVTGGEPAPPVQQILPEFDVQNQGAGRSLPSRPGGAYDPTQTGWVFKDVARPHKLMERGDWLNYHYANATGNHADVQLPIRSLNAAQNTVNPDFAFPISKNTQPPIVIKKGGQYFVTDGHHRITAAAERGQQTVGVRLIDLDGTMQTDFPLLDR